MQIRPDAVSPNSGTYPTERTFYRVDGRDPERMKVIKEILVRILTPLYGDQTKAINQIKRSIDRTCFLLYEDRIPTGVLIFKTVLSNEFAEYGITNSIEIKSLFIDHSAQNSGRGLGSALVDKLKEEVDKLGLNHNGIHVTVSETKQESLMFFRKKGFNIAHSWKGKYLPEVTEYLLYCPTKIEQIEKEAIDSKQRLNASPIQQNLNASNQEPKLFHVIHHVHFDDIHALKRLSDGTFISGSKDNSLYKWNQQGELVRVINEVEPAEQDEKNWITAIGIINDEYWVSGERSSRVSLWKTNGDYVRDLKPKFPRRSSHISHQYNTKRINCFATSLNRDKPGIFIGMPTLFDEYNFIEGRTETSTKTHVNDWVYCIHPLTKDRLLAVTGCTLDIWKKFFNGWDREDTLISEEKRSGKGKTSHHQKKQRPFISSLTPLDSDNQFGLALFDGSVKVFDITQKKVIHEWKEHVGRVWSIEKITQNVFASSGEDKTIKIWDSRQAASTYTISDHVGQVTAMLNLKEHVLIAGTCPEKGSTSQTGAEIRFYDIR